MSSRINNATRNIFFGLINKIVFIILPFIVRTIIIYTLGTEYLGLSGLFTAILNVLSLTELGFDSAIVFSMYKPIAEKDDKTVCALLNFYRVCYKIIGLIILILGIIILPFLKNFISGEYPSSVNIHILYLIYLFNTVSSYLLFAYKNSILVASQRYDLISIVSTILTLCQYCTQIILLFIYKNYYIYIIIMPIVTILNNLCINYLVRKRYPQYKCEGKINSTEFQQIKTKIGGLFCQKIGITANNSIDNIIISMFFGLTTLAIYNNYYYILSSVVAILSMIITSITAIVGNSIVTESKEKNYGDFLKINFSYNWLITWFSTCMICLFQPFMILWVGEDYMFPMYVVILFGIYFYAFRMSNISGLYKEAAGLWWEGKFVPLLAAILNLILNLSFILVFNIGIEGVILSTIISMTFIYFPFGSYILFKHYFQDIKLWYEYIKEQLISFLKALLVWGATLYLCNLVTSNGVQLLFIRFFICMIIPNLLMILLNLRKKELRTLIAMIKNINKVSG